MSAKLAGKRKRGSSASYPIVIAGPRTSYKRRKFTPGVDRTGGFYGRYSGRDGELKFHDVAVNATDVATAGNIQNGGTINIIPQGVTESQRVGRKCTIRSINWRYRFNLSEIDAAADPAAGDNLRIIVYLDKQANGATAAVTDILETANLNSFRNLANSGRFQILKDSYEVLNYLTLASDGAGVVSSAAVAKTKTWYKKCNIPVEFSSTTGAMGEIRSNNLGVLLISNQGVIDFTSTIRLRFSDGN